ncbi:toll-like receptor 6 [Haliotis rubra]|uniref:toll-like receptor 6 n=1 Tax=Haliotis rubra TaxID=36100 RepID=UPI001EE6166A|nr:toll-like receptor 6 [Haliotis rubra]
MALTTLQGLAIYSITYISGDAFQDMSRIEVLDLRYNTVHVKDLQKSLNGFQNTVRSIDVSNNKYFRNLTEDFEDTSKFIKSPESYQCGYPLNLKSTLLIDANISEETCRISPYVFPIIFGLSLVSIVFIVVLSIAYRLRWSIRYCLHMLRYKRRKPIDETIYVYDAFVLYCEDDSPWVRNNIIPRIEDEAKLKLCIHERDFIPGEYIVDNIVTSLERSRKVIMVLSNSFV